MTYLFWDFYYQIHLLQYFFYLRPRSDKSRGNPLQIHKIHRYEQHCNHCRQNELCLSRKEKLLWPNQIEYSGIKETVFTIRNIWNNYLLPFSWKYERSEIIFKCSKYFRKRKFDFNQIRKYSKYRKIIFFCFSLNILYYFYRVRTIIYRVFNHKMDKHILCLWITLGEKFLPFALIFCVRSIKLNFN